MPVAKPIAGVGFPQILGRGASNVLEVVREPGPGGDMVKGTFGTVIKNYTEDSDLRAHLEIDLSKLDTVIPESSQEEVSSK